MSTDYNIDELFNEQVNHAQVADTNAKSLDPAGTYTSRTPMQVTASLDEPSGQYPEGRRTITVFGMGDDDKTGKTARLRVYLSPDPATWDDGSPDGSTKMWAQAVNAYKATFNEAPKTAGLVIEYLRDYPAKYRLIQTGVPTARNPEPKGEPRTRVVGITPVKA